MIDDRKVHASLQLGALFSVLQDISTCRMQLRREAIGLQTAQMLSAFDMGFPSYAGSSLVARSAAWKRSICRGVPS